MVNNNVIKKVINKKIVFLPILIVLVLAIVFIVNRGSYSLLTANLMAGSNGDETTNFLSTSITRQEIQSITFTNSISGHTPNGTNCWDVSLSQDGSVLAWAVEDANTGDYDITIGADGGPVVVSDGTYLFANLVNLISMNGMNYFDTSNVHFMDGMFYNCNSLGSLDLGSFDMSNIDADSNSAMLSGMSNLVALGTPNNYGNASIELPNTMYAVSGTSYTSLNSSSPTSTWLYRYRAKDFAYDNSNTGINCNNVQCMIDYLDTGVLPSDDDDDNSYVVNYYQGNADGSDFSLLGSMDCSYGSACTLRTYENLNGVFPYSDYGWEFSGWSTSENGITIDYNDGDSINIDSGNGVLNLYALGSRTISFSGGATPKSVISTVNQIWNPYNTSSDSVSSISVPNKIDIDGWEFIGYKGVGDIASNVANSSVSIDATGAGNANYKLAYNEYETMVSIYKRVLTLKYDANGGSGDAYNQTIDQYYNSGYGNNSVNVGETLSSVTFTLSNNSFIRNRYTFVGWGNSANATNTMKAGNVYTELNPSLTSTDTMKTLYAIWEENDEFAINDYPYDSTNQYISRILVNTTVNDFMSSIVASNSYTIDVESKKVDNKDLIYTGGKTKIYKNNVLVADITNIVTGDINGDAEVNSADLLKVRQHLLKDKVLSGAYMVSADINYDNEINSADLLRIRQHLIGTKPIS